MNRSIRNAAGVFLLVISAIAAAAAPPELTGQWQGKLAIDATTSVTVEFTFGKDAKGAYTAVLNSLDNPAIKNTQATDVSWDGSNVKLKVAALSGSYSGSLKEGKISGQWVQPGGSLPLVLSPYQKPVLAKAATDTLTGTWSGPLKIPGGELTFVLRFKTDGKGAFGGTLAVPEQGGNEIPMSDVQFSANKLTFRIPQVAGDFSATLVNGMLNGNWKQGGAAATAMPVVLKKGEYAAAVQALKLSPESFAALKGTWKGLLEVTSPQGQKATLNLVLRFGTASSGQFVAFVDSPDQKAMNIPVTDASFADGKLTVKIASLQGTYSGTLSEKTLTGEWKQGTQTSPLVLTR
jgi:hypothetical protein